MQVKGTKHLTIAAREFSNLNTLNLFNAYTTQIKVHYYINHTYLGT